MHPKSRENPRSHAHRGRHQTKSHSQWLGMHGNENHGRYYCAFWMLHSIRAAEVVSQKEHPVACESRHNLKPAQSPSICGGSARRRLPSSLSSCLPSFYYLLPEINKQWLDPISGQDGIDGQYWSLFGCPEITNPETESHRSRRGSVSSIL